MDWLVSFSHTWNLFIRRDVYSEFCIRTNAADRTLARPHLLWERQRPETVPWWAASIRTQPTRTWWKPRAVGCPTGSWRRLLLGYRNHPISCITINHCFINIRSSLINTMYRSQSARLQFKPLDVDDPVIRRPISLHDLFVWDSKPPLLSINNLQWQALIYRDLYQQNWLNTSCELSWSLARLIHSFRPPRETYGRGEP